MSFRGYWYVMVSKPLPPAGSGLTRMWPSPAAEDDVGKGEFMMGDDYRVGGFVYSGVGQEPRHVGHAFSNTGGEYRRGHRSSECHWVSLKSSNILEILSSFVVALEERLLRLADDSAGRYGVKLCCFIGPESRRLPAKAVQFRCTARVQWQRRTSGTPRRAPP